MNKEEDIQNPNHIRTKEEMQQAKRDDEEF